MTGGLRRVSSQQRRILSIPGCHLHQGKLFGHDYDHYVKQLNGSFRVEMGLSTSEDWYDHRLVRSHIKQVLNGKTSGKF